MKGHFGEVAYHNPLLLHTRQKYNFLQVHVHEYQHLIHDLNVDQLGRVLCEIS